MPTAATWQVHQDGRKSILGLVQPEPFPLILPSPVVLLTLCGRAAEELLQKHKRRLLLALWLLLVCWRGPIAARLGRILGRRSSRKGRALVVLPRPPVAA